MAKKKEKIMPLCMLAFTSDSIEQLDRMKFMAESMILHYYMGAGFDVERIHAHIVPTSGLEANCDLPEVVEYVKQLRSFKKDFSIQIDVDLYTKEEEGDLDEL
jgi:hypothetical protein